MIRWNSLDIKCENEWVIFTCQVSFTGPFRWTSWEGGRPGHFLVTKFLNTRLSRILVFRHCPAHHKFPCDGISLLLWLYKHQVWHLSHYYLKFTLKYWNFWKHCFLEFTPVNVSWETGLGSERISMGHILLQNWFVSLPWQCILEIHKHFSYPGLFALALVLQD